MANQRTFNCQGLVTNGVSVGGLSALGLNASFESVITSAPEGAYGAEDVDRAGLKVDASLTCSDVTKAAAILAATVGNTTFSGQESGAATWHDYIVASLLWSGMNLNFPKGADGSLQLTGAGRFADGTKTLADMIAVTGGAAVEPTLTYPTRLHRIYNAGFDPDGADPAISPIHAQSLSVALTANVNQDYGDDDIGMTAVDIVGWQALQVTLVLRDVKAVSPSHIAAELLGSLRGVLTVGVMGRAEAADKTLTINNLLWTGADEKQGADYTEFTLTGQAGWRATSGTQYTLTGTDKLFAFA